MTMINPWMQWSVDLGLVENDRKICVVARTTSVKATMLAYGAEQKWFVPTARILRQPGDVVFCQHAAVGFFANCHKQMQEILALACQPCTHCTIGRPFHTSKNAIDPQLYHYQCFVSYCRQRGWPPMVCAPKLHARPQTLAHHLRNLGWQNSGPWTWTHDECGEIDMTNYFAG